MASSTLTIYISTCDADKITVVWVGGGVGGNYSYAEWIRVVWIDLAVSVKDKHTHF